MDNYLTVKQIVELEKKSGRNSTMSDKIAKLNEELGEFTAVHLEDIGYKYVDIKRDQSEIDNHLLEELCDCYIMIMDMMNYYGFDRDDIYDMTHKKLNKWMNISKKSKTIKI